AFLEVLAGKCQDIMSQLDTQRAREKEENRAAIRPIIETILFCAEQELPLKGDCDSGPLALGKPEKKMANFKLCCDSEQILVMKIREGTSSVKCHTYESGYTKRNNSDMLENSYRRNNEKSKQGKLFYFTCRGNHRRIRHRAIFDLY
ncbi:hypothetical protein ILUMI_01616, partial [Ignelater luminosus]